MRKNGFGLVELVVVIVILDVLAAFAIPRFVSLVSEARAASLEGMLGSLRAASTMAHSHSQALVEERASTDPITIDGVSISMFNRYPDAPGMVDAANIVASDEFQIQMFGTNAFIIWVNGTAGWSACGIAYVRSIPPGIPAPLFLGPNTIGCQLM